MSGGALDYCYSRVEDAASEIRKRATTPVERAFAHHLEETAKALRAIEWVYSGDGDDTAWDKMAKVVGPESVLIQAMDDAVSAKNDLEEAIKVASKLLPCAVEYRP